VDVHAGNVLVISQCWEAATQPPHCPRACFSPQGFPVPDMPGGSSKEVIGLRRKLPHRVRKALFIKRSLLAVVVTGEL
jgi:hypothetical protein